PGANYWDEDSIALPGILSGYRLQARDAAERFVQHRRPGLDRHNADPYTRKRAGPQSNRESVHILQTEAARAKDGIHLFHQSLRQPHLVAKGCYGYDLRTIGKGNAADFARGFQRKNQQPAASISPSSDSHLEPAARMNR